MNSRVTAWLEATVVQWHRDRSIDRVLNVEISQSGLVKGYLSQMWRVSLEVVLLSGDVTIKRFILKGEADNEFGKCWNAKHGVFKREIHMYSVVLRKMESLIDRHGDTNGLLWPRMYGHVQWDNLLLGDLNKAKGYEIIDRRSLMNVQDSLFVMNNIARFHALGMVLLSQGAIQKQEFGHSPLLFDDVIVSFIVDPLKDMNEVIKKSWGEKWFDIAKKIDFLLGDLPQLVKEQLNAAKSVMNVINHGDFKATNIMMKRDRLGNPTKCKLLDFQMSNYNSFTVDLHFFIMMSTKPDTRRNHYDKLMEAYHYSLSETLRFYEYTGKIPSLSELEDEMRRSSILGFVVIPSAGALCLDDNDKLNLDVTVSERRESVNERTYDPALYEMKTFRECYAQDIFKFINEGILY